jgi:primosomal protein N'
MDQDTTRGKFGSKKLSTVLRIGNGCLVGTQMLAKGLILIMLVWDYECR